MTRDDLRKRIARKIKRVRKKLGMTQEAFCAFFNAKEPIDLRMNRENLCRYESETNLIMPEADRYEKILMLEPAAQAPAID